MTIEDVISAFGLPEGCRVNQRVPKKLLAENGAPTAADRRQINDKIEEFTWLAVLKPDTIGVLAFRDEIREYLELSVLHIVLRTGANTARLTELIHRAIPYPVILLATDTRGLSLSLAHKRWSQGETAKTVLDGETISAHLTDNPAESAFLSSFALPSQTRTHLYALYQSWFDSLIALHAAYITGTFLKSTSPQHSEVRRTALRDCVRFMAEIERLHASAVKEKQLPRQVALNLELKRVQYALNQTKEHLLQG